MPQKKIIVLTFLFSALSALAFAQTPEERDPQSRQFPQASSSAQELIYNLAFSRDGLTFSRLNNYDLVRLPGCIFTREAAKPQVPYKVLHIAIEEGKELDKVEIISDQVEVIERRVMLYPVQPSVPYSEKRPFTPPDPKTYQSAEGYPKERLAISGQGSLRGIKIAAIFVYPLEYIPAQRRLLLHTNLTVKVTFKPKRVTALSTAVKPAKRSRQAKQLQPAVDYLIITSESLKASGVFQPLIESKIAKGLCVGAASVEGIQATTPGRDPQEKIRNFIKKKFADNGVLWVLLGGDTNIIPVRMAVVKHQEIPCDMYYSDLDGDWDTDKDNRFGEFLHDNIDLYPDVFVGRAPVKTESEARAFVNKVLTYEKNIHEYSGKALFLGQKDFDDEGGRVSDLIIQEYLPKDFDIVTKYFERDGSYHAQLAIQAINQGYHLINHIGHADKTWLRLVSASLGQEPEQITIEDVDNLTNYQAPAILWSNGCYPAAIDDDCIAKHWITNPNGGGAAFIGNSRGGQVPESAELCPAFYESLFRKGLTHIGQAFADSKIGFIPVAKNGDIAMRHALFELNLFGDPEMNIQIAAGSQLNISSPSSTSYVKGKVDISGSAYLKEGFKRYELYCAPSTRLYMSESPVRDGVLMREWDTTRFEDGEYILTLKLITSGGQVIENRNKTKVIIDNYNQRPGFINLVNQGAVINRPFEFRVSASDPDDPKAPWGKLEYSADNLPAGAHFYPATQVFSWFPKDADKGIYRVTFTVEDSQYSVSKTITLATVVIEESRITSKGSWGWDYNFYADKIVWSNGMDNHIYLRDFSQPGQEKMLTTFIDPLNDQLRFEFDPVIYKDKIIFRVSGGDVYMYDLSQSAIPPPQLICHAGAITDDSLAVYENKIVWEDSSKDNPGIYIYDLAKPNPEEEGVPISLGPLWQSHPAIYENSIVWISGGSEEPGGIRLHGRVYRYDLSNPEQAENGSPLSNLAAAERPVVYGSKVVWEDYRNSKAGQIYLYGLSTHEQISITPTYSSVNDPAIYADKIVWSDRRNDKGDIYLYDLAGEMEVRITDAAVLQADPKIFKNRICWIDWRNDTENAGLNDIYSATVIFVPQVSAIDQAVAAANSRIVIKGRNFGETRTSGKVVFANGAVAPVRSWSDTQITCIVPRNAASGEVKVITEGGQSNGVALAIDSTPPVITPAPIVSPLTAYQPLTISAGISDSGSGVKQATLYWRKRRAMQLRPRYEESPMADAQKNGSYQAVLPANNLERGTYYYYIAACDNAGNWKSTPEYSFRVN